MRKMMLWTTSALIAAGAPLATIGQELQDDMAGTFLEEDGMENDPRAMAIMDAMSDLSLLEEEELAQAIASLMVQFTASMEEQDFLDAIFNWRTSLAPGIDSSEILGALESSSWLSNGIEAPDARVVHFLMDTACDPCIEMLGDLREISDHTGLDLRVTVLPLVEDDTFPISIGLLSQSDTAWENLMGVVSGDVSPGDVAVEPDAENEEVQARIEQDYDALVATGLRSLPITGFRTEEGEARIIMGAMEIDEIQQILDQN